jgi:hypothetical protein
MSSFLVERVLQRSTSSSATVTALDCVPTGVELFGASTSACMGELQLNVLIMPQAGVSGFGFFLSQAPPNSSGWLVLGSEAGMSMPLAGAGFLLDPTRRLLRRAITTDGDGWCETPFPLDGVAPGMSFAAQALVRNTATCTGSGRLSSSNGVSVVVQ